MRVLPVRDSKVSLLTIKTEGDNSIKVGVYGAKPKTTKETAPLLMTVELTPCEVTVLLEMLARALVDVRNH